MAGDLPRSAFRNRQVVNDGGALPFATIRSAIKSSSVKHGSDDDKNHQPDNDEGLCAGHVPIERVAAMRANLCRPPDFARAIRAYLRF